jgi:uncharacterized membrane protein
LAPTLAVVGAVLFLGEEFSVKKAVGLVLVVGGVILLTTRNGPGH